ncbi:ATP-binding cassette domain-containing protein [bacterium]|nr:MAG: ATP-binding cassette domain-containing protein [bacterium]
MGHVNRYIKESPSAALIAWRRAPPGIRRKRAGKSTLIKLITWLHEPSEGRILWNGHDVREFSEAEIRERTTVLL